MASDKEKYHAKRSNKKDNADSDKKIAKIAAKIAADYYTGGQGGKAVDALANTKAGDAILGHVGKTLAKGNSALSKAGKKLDKIGALDAVDKGVSGFGSGASKGDMNSSVPKKNINSNNFNKSNLGEKSKTNSLNDNKIRSEKNNKLNSFLNNNLKNQKKIDDNQGQSDEREDTSGDDFNGTTLIAGYVTGAFKKVAITLLPFIVAIVIIVITVVLISEVVSGQPVQTNNRVQEIARGSIISDGAGRTDSQYVNKLIEINKSPEYSSKNINTALVDCVFSVIVSNSHNLVFDDFTKEQIIVIIDSMYVNGVYDEANFRLNLDSILRGYFPDYHTENIQDLIDQIYEFYEIYKSRYGQSTNYNNVCAVAGSCSYSIKGISTGDRNISKNIDISNLKVRLMQGGSWNGGSCGGTWGLELPNEELVDFEKYVLGVAYAESGGNSFEALKAQIIAARNFALSRADLMGNTYGRKLYQENGQWILQITNCVSDQAYCDPDKGCSKDVAAGNQWGNVHSGINNPITYKPPLAENAPLRQAAMEVNGEILINSSGYIVYTPYTNTNQVRWNSMANSGSDYKQILLSDYGSRGATNIEKMSCNTDGAGCNEVVGDYATWLQSGQSWSGIQLGTSSHTISSAGCLVTSISMLIAKSGVPTNVNGPFNPGTFVQKMNSVGGIDGNGNFQWYKVSEAAPNFQFVSKVYVSGKTREEKLKVINDLVAQGYYVVVEVMGNTGQHWVAIDSVNGENIFMYDPATKYTDLWSRYNYNNTSAVAYFKVNG